MDDFRKEFGMADDCLVCPQDERKCQYDMSYSKMDFCEWLDWYLDAHPSAEPEIIRCKDCKFYTPMNRETRTGICRLLMHQNFGDDWFCAGAERRTDERLN